MKYGKLALSKVDSIGTKKNFHHRKALFSALCRELKKKKIIILKNMFIKLVVYWVVSSTRTSADAECQVVMYKERTTDAHMK